MLFQYLEFLIMVIISSHLVHGSPINRQGGLSENIYITVQNDTYGIEQRVCTIDSTTYEDGESIPTSSPCEHCLCRPPGFACTIISCEFRPGCKALKRSDQCCPEYQCDCEKDGKIYQNGEKILDDNNPCEVCYCQGGDVVCAVIDCYWRSDCQPRYIENRCCPLYDHCPPSSSTMSPYTQLSAILSTTQSSLSSSKHPSTATEGLLAISKFTQVISESTSEFPLTSSLTSVVISEFPEVGSEVPSNTSKISFVNSEAPIHVSEVPVVTTEVTAVTTEVRVVTTEVPVVTTEVPVVTTEVPVVTTEAPVVTTEAPVVTTEVPVVTTEVPVVTTEVPVVTTEVPVVTTEVPVVTSKAPLDTLTNAAVSSEVQVLTSEVPLIISEAPPIEILISESNVHPAESELPLSDFPVNITDIAIPLPTVAESAPEVLLVAASNTSVVSDIPVSASETELSIFEATVDPNFSVTSSEILNIANEDQTFSTPAPITSSQVSEISSEVPMISSTVLLTTSEVPYVFPTVQAVSSENLSLIPGINSSEVPIVSPKVQETASEVPIVSPKVQETASEVPIAASVLPMSPEAPLTPEIFVVAEEIPYTTSHQSLTNPSALPAGDSNFFDNVELLESDLTTKEGPVNSSEILEIDLPKDVADLVNFSEESHTSYEAPLATSEIVLIDPEVPLATSPIPITKDENLPASSEVAVPLGESELHDPVDDVANIIYEDHFTSSEAPATTSQVPIIDYEPSGNGSKVTAEEPEKIISIYDDPSKLSQVFPTPSEVVVEVYETTATPNHDASAPSNSAVLEFENTGISSQVSSIIGDGQIPLSMIPPTKHSSGHPLVNDDEVLSVESKATVGTTEQTMILDLDSPRPEDHIIIVDFDTGMTVVPTEMGETDVTASPSDLVQLDDLDTVIIKTETNEDKFPQNEFPGTTSIPSSIDIEDTEKIVSPITLPLILPLADEPETLSVTDEVISNPTELPSISTDKDIPSNASSKSSTLSEVVETDPIPNDHEFHPRQTTIKPEIVSEVYATTQIILESEDLNSAETETTPFPNKFRMDLSQEYSEEVQADSATEKVSFKLDRIDPQAIDIIPADEPKLDTFSTVVDFSGEKDTESTINPVAESIVAEVTIPPPQQRHHHFQGNVEENELTTLLPQQRHHIQGHEEDDEFTTSTALNLQSKDVSIRPIEIEVKSPQLKFQIPIELVKRVDPIADDIENDSGRSDMRSDADNEVSNVDSIWYWRTYDRIRSLFPDSRSKLPRRPRRSATSTTTTTTTTSSSSWGWGLPRFIFW